MAETTERQYALLIVSASEKFNTSVKKVLPSGRFRRVEIKKSVSMAQRALLDQTYDLVIIHAPLPDSLGTDLAMDVVAKGFTQLLLVTPQEIAVNVADQVAQHGVFVLSSVASEQELRRQLEIICALRDQLSKAFDRVKKLESKLEEEKLFGQAKCLLVKHKNFTEAEAHRYIGKQAMDRCIAKKVIAKEIIEEWEE